MPHPGRIDLAAISTAAADLLRERGQDGVTMREVARRVGVSAPSLYFHVPSREDLLGLLVREGLLRLGHSLQSVLDPQDARATAHAMADAYVTFALENPHLFDLTFGPCLPGMPAYGSEAASRALLEMVGAMVSPDDLLPVAQTFWSFVHGYATLTLNGQFRLGEPERALHRGVDVLLDGLGVGVATVTR